MTFRLTILLPLILIGCQRNTDKVAENRSPSVMVSEFLKNEPGIRPLFDRDSISTFDSALLALTERYIVDSLKRNPTEYYYWLFYETYDDVMTRQVTIYDTTSIYFDSLRQRPKLLKVHHLYFTKNKVLLGVGRTLTPFDHFEFGQLPVDKLDTVKNDKFAPLVQDAIRKLYKNTGNLVAIRLTVTPADTSEGVAPGEYYKVTSKDYYNPYILSRDTFPKTYFQLDLRNGRIVDTKIR